MPEKILNYFILAFQNLNRGTGKVKEKAPHKPVLLLSIIQAYENKLLTTNQIPISPELTEIFKTYWNLLVTTDHTLGFAMPFFYLKNEKGHWWKLVANPGCEMWVESGKLTSFSNLSVAVAYATIDPKLAELLRDETSRSMLRRTLIDEYFPGQTGMIIEKPEGEIDGLRREMLEEAPADYRAKLKGLKKRLNAETYQIEVYARDTVFRREIVRLYNDRCCITGVRVSAPYTFSMVDACHIVPFYKTFNNHPTNGIALCPNLHRAFDKGAISIDDRYRVIVSPTFVENDASVYSLRALAGIQLELPKDERYLPDLEAVAWHRRHTLKL